MIDFPITIERLRTEAARVVIRAESREEAERIAWERARDDQLIWESDCEDVSVTVEER